MSRIGVTGVMILFAALIWPAGLAVGGERESGRGPLRCLELTGRVECVEGTQAEDYPGDWGPEVARLARLELLGWDDRIDPGEESWRLFLLWSGAGSLSPELAGALRDQLEGYLERTWAARLESVAARSAHLRWAVRLILVDAPFAAGWERTERQLDELFRAREPGFAQRVMWRHPGGRIDYLGLLGRALVRNAQFLAVAGRRAEGQRMVRAAEELYGPEGAMEGPWSALLAGTFARFLLAGWRDVDDPPTALEQSLAQALANVRELRRAARSGLEPPSAPPPVATLALDLALGGRLVRLPLRLALAPLLSAEQGARWLPLFAPDPPSPGGGQQAVVDEVTNALNLPFWFVPPNAALTAHLGRFTGPEGLAAVALGAGDGAEPLALARHGGFSRVVAVDHSLAACERVEMLFAVLRGALALAPCEVWRGDVRAFELAAGEAGLVTAVHLLEYLAPEEREQLLRRVAGWLAPGGEFLGVVHLSGGPRLAGLVAQAANVRGESDGLGGTRLTMESTVPAQPSAVQVQWFPAEDQLRRELALSFPEAAGFTWTVRTEQSKSGMVEAVVAVARSEINSEAPRE